MICLDVCCCCLVLSHVKHFCDPMDYILQGCSVHGISQARILEQVVISLPRGSSQPRDWTPLPSLGGIFTTETEINMYLLSIYVSELPESLLSVINFGKFSVMITSNILFFFFFSSVITPFVIVHWLLDTLSSPFHFFLFPSQLWELLLAFIFQAHWLFP